ncbi:hypothetical protein EDB92DRAFT_2111491 [Lactarius akahatsu]|uniref:F-box domain-containing protein n=1 Tax=Lactarius akahatsu TaxID=416441 RepID=A0AAD4LU03_9AGAM|nr:hypothetical protein EDB92DRAFT_2111491 [Lactarius akahatsu]
MGSSYQLQQQAIDAEIRSLEGSIRALKLRRNTFAPISSLPNEVIAIIFSFLRARVTLFAIKPGKKPDGLAWLRVAHVCHQWREIALNQPHFWSHVDFTAVSSAGAAEILSRAKTVPLHLEVGAPVGLWDDARFGPFQKELQDRVPHICRLAISAEPFHLHRILKGLIMPAPTLEFLSLASENDHRGGAAFVPDSLFDGSTPRLSSLELWNCDISWMSPLLGSLKHLEIRSPFKWPSLSVWLDALDQMPQLKTLALHRASPVAPWGLIPSEVERAVTLPSLTHFEVSSPARYCGFALAHLILPALTSLCVVAESSRRDYSDVQEILTFVSRHAHGPQDSRPLQSVLVRSNGMGVEIVAWTSPDVHVELSEQISVSDARHSGRVSFSITNSDDWSPRVDTGTLSAVMEALPLDGLVTFTAQNRFNRQFWLWHAPKWPLLRHVRLTPAAERGFREMLMEDNKRRGGPLLPLLKTLVLVDVALLERRNLRLCDALTKRVEQGVPLETLDLRKCLATGHAIELLSKIVVDVLAPEKTYETGSDLVSEAGARLIYVEDEYSEVEDYDEDDADTGSDDEVQDMDGDTSSDIYGEGEAVYW